jgi:hypothetical protein
MKVDIRGRRLLSNELLSAEDQSGLLAANDHEELDDHDDSTDVAWIPNGRILRECEEARATATDGNYDSDGEMNTGTMVGGSHAATASAEFADLVDEERDDLRRSLLSDGWKQRPS